MDRVIGTGVLLCLFGGPAGAQAAEPGPACDCGLELPPVHERAQGYDALGERVVAYGVIKRVPMRKGKGSWKGTGLVLDDDTVLYVSYGEPPTGWEGMLGERVCVRGRLLNWSSLTKQSLRALHLSELDFPVRVDPDDKPFPADSLAARVGHDVLLTGTARNAKGGAVLVTESGEPVYIGKLPRWAESYLGKRVTYGGRLGRRKYLPEARVDEHGAISQGAHGKQYVLEDACQIFLPPKERK